MGENKKKSGQNPEDDFTFELEQRLQCTSCNKVKYNRKKEQYLFLPIPVDPKCEKGTPVDLDACIDAYFAEGAIEGLNCPFCNKSTLHSERLRFMSYPKTLAMVFKRIVYADWVPKKLEVEIQTDIEAI